VIPYVPGYTPKTPDGNPLVPVDPEHPENGYKVPPVPTTPGTNTDITYVADPQKAVVKVFNTTTGKEVELPAEKVSIDNGTTDSAIPTDSVTAKIADLEKRGYVVENKDLLNNQKFDNQKDSETGDPTQVFNLKVHEKVVEVTEPPTPNTPVDPNVPVEPNKPVDPTVPKWPAEGLKESDLKKEVTRTITYVKKETPNGEEVASGKDPVTQTAHFTRKASYNVVTGAITYGNWESTDKELAKVDTPTLTGYVADKASVDKVETNADSTGLDQKVVYTKLGSWVPRLPEGVKPPTGTDMTPKPYPNHPTDPTTPGTPVYPEPGQPITPGTPVIPYVPGYTPKTPDGNPLVPVDPEHPENGYKVPPVPTTPGTNTDITYVADPQKAVVKVFNTTTGKEVELPAEKVSIDNGTTDSAIPTDSVTAKIADLEKRGYVVENKDLLNNQKFDNQKDSETGDPTQVFNLKVHEKVVEVTEPPTPNTPVDPNVPVEPNKPVDPTVPKWPAEGLKESDLKKEVTRTITYVKKETADGKEEPSGKDPVTQTAHFTRKASYNVVTGTITYGKWESTDKTLEAVPTEKLDGYVANVPSVEEVETNVNSTNLDRKVVYTKLGSWVPKVPGVETPTPLPYPNHPTDPTKPGDPTDPNVPVIPYVPGYTPKIGETPLQPKVPNDPTQGYIPPAVPTEPGTNTDITYVADPQKAVVKVFNTTTGTEVELPTEKVSIDNGTTDSAIPTDSVTAKIADLEKRGYVVENKDLLNNQKFDNEKDPTDGDPTQVFKLKVHEKVVTVTEPKNPNDPVDPDKPEGPKWPTEGLAKSDLEKEVTRTITYVKKETADGPEIADAKPTKKQTAHFKRSATYNLVTKVVTPGEWTSTDKTLEAVPTEKLDGYVANVSSVEEVETNVNSTNLDRKVVYTKLGSWIPKVPGVETPTPLPYPNNPTDPTKPGDPTDPTTPNVPVIPYVPGYTPKTPDGNPLVPKVPNDPTQGYIPPVPTEPGQDTPIEYVKVPNTPSPEEPVKPTPESNHITIWVDENGKPLKPEKPGTHEPGNIPGYRYITTVTKDGVTIHKFEKITPVDPNNPVPQKPTTPIPTPQDPTIPTPESQIPTPNTPEANTPTSETNRREELPNTGTEANATLASAGIMTLLAGLGLGFFKKKEDEK
ncbi:mucin-binding protein, partial [Streptococcus mitis]|uniref:mucin-binding protein n=1 Tax=Streptococcus mitis TaxID=28037 RepID=UPI0012946AB9